MSQGRVPSFHNNTFALSVNFKLICVLSRDKLDIFHEILAPLATVSLWTRMRAVSGVIATLQSAILPWFFSSAKQLSAFCIQPHSRF